MRTLDVGRPPIVVECTKGSPSRRVLRRAGCGPLIGGVSEPGLDFRLAIVVVIGKFHAIGLDRVLDGEWDSADLVDYASGRRRAERTWIFRGKIRPELLVSFIGWIVPDLRIDATPILRGVAAVYGPQLT